MNILWISWKDITHPDAGGAEIYSEHMARYLVEKGHHVTWLSLRYPHSLQHEVRDGITYHRFSNKLLFHLGFFHLLVFFQYLFTYKNHVDLVVDEAHGPPLLTPLYVKKKHILLIHEVAGEIWNKMVPFPLGHFGQYVLDPLLFKLYRATPIVTVSESTKDELIKLGIPADNITIIYNGIDAPLSENTNLPKQTIPTVMFLSQLRPMKGFDRVYQAFTKLQSKLPNVQLWVVGDDSSPYAQKLKQQILSEHGNNAVTFYGKVSSDKKSDLLQRAKILVHGSYKEGWGRVVLEANALGTPAVVFDAAGLRNSVKHNETGYVAQSDEEFVKYCQLLIEDQPRYNTMQLNAKQWATNFTWEQAADSFYTFITTKI